MNAARAAGNMPSFWFGMYPQYLSGQSPRPATFGRGSQPPLPPFTKAVISSFCHGPCSAVYALPSLGRKSIP